MKIISSEYLFERRSAYRRVKDAAMYQSANETNVKNRVYRSVEIILWPELNREATK